jgi:hypothetical protein
VKVVKSENGKYLLLLAHDVRCGLTKSSRADDD